MLARIHGLKRVAIVVAFLLAGGGTATAAPVTAMFALDNGMQVVVIEDRQSPVVTHMVWYRVGAADDPVGKSGLAHFLEHLMFKATAMHPTGEFTRIVNRVGGRHNALTTHDTTCYFQRVAKEHLETVMELEADRMRNLRFEPEEVRTERAVIGEERRANVDASPIARLNEQVLAQLYQNHPYGRPVLGWSHEMGALELDDARSLHQRHYAPNNAVLVVAGNVSETEVRRIAEATYARIPAHPDVAPRARAAEPPSVAARSLVLVDAQAGASALMLRSYHVPSARTAQPGEAEALTLLARILGGDETGRLHRALVLEQGIALVAGADYQGGGLDSGRFSVVLQARPGVDPGRLVQALDDMVRAILETGVTAAEMERAKRAADVDDAFEMDEQERLARRIGEAVTLGRSPAALADFAVELRALRPERLRDVARAYLTPQRSSTGILRQPETDSAAAAMPPSAANKEAR